MMGTSIANPWKLRQGSSGARRSRCVLALGCALIASACSDSAVGTGGSGGDLSGGQSPVGGAGGSWAGGAGGGGAAPPGGAGGVGGDGGAGGGCVPFDDGNPCTDDLCFDGHAENLPVQVGTSCGAALFCSVDATCVVCLSDADCTGEETCFAGACLPPVGGLWARRFGGPGNENILGLSVTEASLLFAAVGEIDVGGVPAVGGELVLGSLASESGAGLASRAFQSAPMDWPPYYQNHALTAELAAPGSDGSLFVASDFFGVLDLDGETVRGDDVPLLMKALPDTSISFWRHVIWAPGYDPVGDHCYDEWVDALAGDETGGVLAAGGASIYGQCNSQVPMLDRTDSSGAVAPLFGPAWWASGNTFTGIATDAAGAIGVIGKLAAPNTPFDDGCAAMLPPSAGFVAVYTAQYACTAVMALALLPEKLAMVGGGPVLVFKSAAPLTIGGQTYPANPGGHYLVRLDPDLNVVWVKQYGGVSKITALAAGPGGDLLVGGQFVAPAQLGSGEVVPAGASDIFVIRLAPDGTHVWTRTYGGPGVESDCTLAFDASGYVMVGAQANDELVLGGQALTSAGGVDLVIARTPP